MTKRSIKAKIILVTTLCVLLVGIVSNVFLYTYLSDIILEKSNHISSISLENLRRQIDTRIKSFENLGNLCANDSLIARALRQDAISSSYEKKTFLEAQSVLQQYLNGSGLDLYVDKLIAFNEKDLAVQVFGRSQNLEKDPFLIRKQQFFKDFAKENSRHKVFITTGVSSGEEVIGFLSPVYETTTQEYRGWVYMELNNLWMREAFESYDEGSFFLYKDKTTLYPENHSYPYDNEKVKAMLQKPEGFSLNGSTVQTHLTPLRVSDLEIGSVTDISFLGKDGQPIFFTVLVVVATSIIVAVLLAIILSNFITGPINRLTYRIQRISDNDFSYDPSIEKGEDEIATVGRMINDMSGSIKHLLKETEEMYEQQKNSEMALLQSQINPHFLYNTLDSIHWMATIQKNTGIMNMTRSLSSLLKNIAKGVGDTISLQEEISLLEEYTTIQSIRYMENFQVIFDIPDEHRQYGIIKLTLQPLVENAIFHGIEPTGTYGTITISSQEEGEDLILRVRDDGVGMTEKEIQSILDTSREDSRSSFSGMGVRNVHERLQLIHGKEYGLSYDSIKGEYTEVTVRIPKQQLDDIGEDIHV